MENRLFPRVLFPEKGNVLMKGLVYRWNMTLVSEQTAVVLSCQEENSKICASNIHSAPQDCSCIRAYMVGIHTQTFMCSADAGWFLVGYWILKQKSVEKLPTYALNQIPTVFFCPTKRSHLPPCDLYAWIRLRFQFALARIFGWNPGMGNDDIVQNQSVTTGSCTNLKLIVTRDRYSKRTISKS